MINKISQATEKFLIGELKLESNKIIIKFTIWSTLLCSAKMTTTQADTVNWKESN